MDLSDLQEKIEIQRTVRVQGASRKEFLYLTPNALRFTNEDADMR
jgi:hypothetical protein